MSELMSQEEINAMLNGAAQSTGDGSEEITTDTAADVVGEEMVEQSDYQAETSEQVEEAEPDLSQANHSIDPADLPECLSEMEADALGEIGNICMGAAATALYTILGRKVSITTPQVECTTPDILASEYDIPFVIVDVQYTEGVVGNNLLILRIDDVKKITDIMMGGDGTNIDDSDLSELHLSAISEAMNQMMGGMSTSMADMLNRIVNISPPQTLVIELSGQEIKTLINSESDALVKIGFKMEIEGIIDSGIMQLMPMSFASELVGTVLGSFSDENDTEELAETIPEAIAERQEGQQSEIASSASTDVPAASQPPVENYYQTEPKTGTNPDNSNVQMPPHAPPEQQQNYNQPQAQPGTNQAYPGYPGYPPAPGGDNSNAHMPYPPYPQYGYPPYQGQPNMQYPGWPQMQSQQAPYHTPGKDLSSRTPEQHVDVRPVQLNDFDNNESGIPQEDGIEMIMDVPLQITVELGQSKKTIKDILDISVGSVITLDKVAGEPVDIVINGKMIAKGEVIVIDDNYGVRITEIISPSNRLRNIR